MDELLDTSEPLIHDTYGYAAQGLINLMLTGRAVPHVWDYDKDVGGLSKIYVFRELYNWNKFVFLLLRTARNKSTIGYWFYYAYGTIKVLYGWIVL